MGGLLAGGEDEVRRDADERERLGEGDTQVHQDLEATLQLGLASDGLDRLADDDSHTDGRSDGGEAVTDRRDVSAEFRENSGVHVYFLP